MAKQWADLFGVQGDGQKYFTEDWEWVVCPPLKYFAIIV